MEGMNCGGFFAEETKRNGLNSSKSGGNRLSGEKFEREIRTVCALGARAPRTFSCENANSTTCIPRTSHLRMTAVVFKV